MLTKKLATWRFIPYIKLASRTTKPLPFQLTLTACDSFVFDEVSPQRTRYANRSIIYMIKGHSKGFICLYACTCTYVNSLVKRKWVAITIAVIRNLRQFSRLNNNNWGYFWRCQSAICQYLIESLRDYFYRTANCVTTFMKQLNC